MTFTQGEDETGGPCFYWTNPWTGKREVIARMFWPEHPPEATAEVELMVYSMMLSATHDPKPN